MQDEENTPRQRARPTAAMVARCGLGVLRRISAGLVGLGLALGPVATAEAHGLPPVEAATSPVQRVAIFGSDDRQLLPAHLADLQDSVGVLFNQRARRVCTAFCVAPDIIATAAHCLQRSDGDRSFRLEDFFFSTRYETRAGTVRLAGARASRTAHYVLSGATELAVKPPIEATRDWALVRLEQAACKRSLPVRAVPTEQILQDAQRQLVFQVAYHRDFEAWRLAWSQPCDVKRSFPGADWSVIAADFVDPANLLLHTCDTGGASSGSPLLRLGPDGFEAVGLSVGTYEEAKVEIESGRVVKRGRSTAVANTGVNAVVFAAKLDLYRNARILTAAPDIRFLQIALRQRGHFAGSINGAYDAGLRRAIESFERVQGLTVLGLPTQALLKRLQGPAAQTSLPRGPG